MKTEYIVLNHDRNVSLTVYLQDIEGEFAGLIRRPAVLILPGGGYRMCSELEADPAAFPYLKAGYQAFILRYSVGENSTWPNPLNDYEQAMEMILENAEAWHICKERIAVVGFSAGGHLAGCAATMAKYRPAAAILGYPVIEGDCAKIYESTAPDVISAIDNHTCPCFVFATRTDNLVPVKNTIHFLEALEKHDVAFESHIYSNGPHGASICTSSVTVPEQFCDRVPHWVEDSIQWLKDVMGDFGSGEMKPPKFGAKINGNHDEYLNLDCTMGYLMNKPEAQKILEPLMAGAAQADNEDMANAPGMMSPEIIFAAMQLMTLRQILAYGNVSPEAAEQIEAQLNRIKND